MPNYELKTIINCKGRKCNCIDTLAVLRHFEELADEAYGSRDLVTSLNTHEREHLNCK